MNESDHQQLLGNDGAPHKVTWKGKEWTLHFLDQKQKAEIVARLKERALKSVTDLKDVIDPDSYQLMLENWQRAATAGEFAYMGPHHLRSFRTRAGQIELFRAILGEKQSSTLTDDEAGDFLDDPHTLALFGLVLEESLPPKVRPAFRAEWERAAEKIRQQSSPSPT